MKAQAFDDVALPLQDQSLGSANRALWGSLHSPEDCPSPGDQFSRGQGGIEDVIGPRIEEGDAVVDRLDTADDDDGGVHPCGPESLHGADSFPAV